MKTRAQYALAYNGLTTSQFAERTGQSVNQVRQLIAAGWFDDQDAPDGRPELLDIARIGAKQPAYRIHPAAVERFDRERSQRREYPKRERKAS